MRVTVYVKGLLVAIFITIICGCNQKTTPEMRDEDTAERELPSQEMWNSTITISRLGMTQAVVAYGHMIKYEKEKVAHFDEGVQVDFYDDDGGHTSTLTAQRGEYNEKTDDVKGLGNVVVVSDSGYALKTEELRWENQRQKIRSDTLVMVVSPEKDTLWSVGFESNADLSHRIFFHPRIITQKNVDLGELESSFTEKDTVKQDSLRKLP